MTKVVDLAEEKFKRLAAGKVLETCEIVDNAFLKAIYDDGLTPAEILPALAHRLGYFCSMVAPGEEKEALTRYCTDIITRIANKDPEDE